MHWHMHIQQVIQAPVPFKAVVCSHICTGCDCRWSIACRRKRCTARLGHRVTTSARCTAGMPPGRGNVQARRRYLQVVYGSERVRSVYMTNMGGMTAYFWLQQQRQQFACDMALASLRSRALHATYSGCMHVSLLTLAARLVRQGLLVVRAILADVLPASVRVLGRRACHTDATRFLLPRWAEAFRIDCSAQVVKSGLQMVACSGLSSLHSCKPG